MYSEGWEVTVHDIRYPFNLDAWTDYNGKSASFGVAEVWPSCKVQHSSFEL